MLTAMLNKLMLNTEKKKPPTKLFSYRAMALALIAMTGLLALPAPAEVLQGRIEDSNTIMRLQRPGAGTAVGNGPVAAPPLRIARPSLAAAPLSGLVDTGAFKPLQGAASDDGAKLGLLKPNDFATIPPAKFDLGAERGSREMVLAWERWHKQLSAAIYDRWSQMADTPGQATVRLTVTKDRSLRADMVRSSGNPDFDRTLMAAIRSIDGNPGLTFPAKSVRQQVSLETDYIADSNVRPGYSWIKNDYEKLRTSY